MTAPTTTLLVVGKGVHLPTEFRGVFLGRYAPQSIDIYYVASRVPAQGILREERVH